MAVNVSPRQMQSSSARHAEVAGSLPDSSSSSLLYIYAVECGMKAALMKRGNMIDSSSLPSELRTHSLRKLAKELRLPPGIDFSRLRCGPRNGVGSKIEEQELHEAWRYGRELSAPDEARAKLILGELLDWCKIEAGGVYR